MIDTTFRIATPARESPVISCPASSGVLATTAKTLPSCHQGDPDLCGGSATGYRRRYSRLARPGLMIPAAQIAQKCAPRCFFPRRMSFAYYDMRRQSSFDPIRDRFCRVNCTDGGSPSLNRPATLGCCPLFTIARCQRRPPDIAILDNPRAHLCTDARKTQKSGHWRPPLVGRRPGRPGLDLSLRPRTCLPTVRMT